MKAIKSIMSFLDGRKTKVGVLIYAVLEIMTACEILDKEITSSLKMTIADPIMLIGVSHWLKKEIGRFVTKK